MRLSMHLLPALLIAAALAFPRPLKESIGVQAIVERVELLPDANAPETIRIHGVFVVGVAHPYYEGKVSYRLGRGYLHYRRNEQYRATTRREWDAIRNAAGTGKPISFGALGGRNGTLRSPSSPPGKPDEYPIGLGVSTKLPSGTLIWGTTLMTAPVFPAPNDTIATRDVRLVALPAVRPGLRYTFEIEVDGKAMQSPPIEADDDGRLVWTPPVELEPAKTYGWRVWASETAPPKLNWHFHTPGDR